MSKHSTCYHLAIFIAFLLLCLATTANSQSNGISLRNDITVEHIIEFPKDGFGQEPLRLVKDEVTGNLLYNEYGGTIWEIDITSPSPAFNFRYSAFDHGLPIVQGMTMHDDILYLVGNEEVNGGNENIGIIAKGVRTNGNQRTWSVIARTEPYLGKPETPFDHKMSGNTVSPDGQFIYVSSSSRTNHGELAGGGREADLTSIILKIPTNPSTTINLLNNRDWLRNNGYLYAEGIRNGFDMAFDNNGNLFEVENSGQRDDPEEMNWLRAGKHYGFPYRLGGNDNPIRVPGYDSTNDPLVPDDQKGQPLFDYDPNFPPPPAGVTFVEPVRNFGPDADLFRDPISGAIRDASNEGSSITTFTAHRSPVGFGFDNANVMGGGFTGDAFMASFSGSTWPLLNSDGEDLLHIELTYNATLDNYDANMHKLASGFAQPIDIVVDDNIIWLAEYGDGNNRGLWKITLPCGNPAVCGTVNPPTYSCEDIVVQGGEGQININGLTAPNEIVQVFDQNFALVFRCEGGDCGSEKLIKNLAAGKYIIGVQFYDENFGFVCAKEDMEVTVTDGGTTGGDCDDLTITGGEGQIEVTGLTAPIEIVQIFDANYNSIFRCQGADCGSEQLIENLSAGDYIVGVQFYTTNWQLICTKENVTVKVTDGGGTNEPKCSDINAFASNSDLTIDGLTAPIEIVQVFDESYNLVFRCQGGDCGTTQTIPNLAEGNYFVNVQFYTADWRFICAEENNTVRIDGGGGGILCQGATKTGFTYLGSVLAQEFYVSNNSLPWKDAAAACANSGSQLATSLGEEEITFIKNNIPNEAFIHLNDEAQEGSFQWQNGRNYEGIVNENSDGNDFVFIATWSAQPIATNQAVWKPFVCAVPCAIAANGSDSRTLDKTDYEKEITLFPNPAQTSIEVQLLALQGKKGSIQIHNIYGQLVERFDQELFHQPAKRIDLKGYENGWYILTIEAEKMAKISKRFVVEHWK